MDDLLQKITKVSGLSMRDVRTECSSIKIEMLNRYKSENDEGFEKELSEKLQEHFNMCLDENPINSLFENFKEKKFKEDLDDLESFDDLDDNYDPFETLREIIEALRSSDPHEENLLAPFLDVIYDYTYLMSEDVVEDLVEALLDHYAPDDEEDDDEDDWDDDDEWDDDEDFEESLNELNSISLLFEAAVSPIKKKRLRYLKNKRRKQLGKRGKSAAFKRTHQFNKKKGRFVKRKKAISVGAQRKKARIFNKVKRKGSTKAKSKRMKKRLKNVRNPYGK